MNRLPEGLLATLAASSFLFSAQAQGPPPTITFFVASDSHFGAGRMSELNRSIVEQMNALPGTDYPAEMGGRVEAPRGVLFTGDMTDNGHIEEFAEFEEVYGRKGGDGLLAFPVFEALGNHDLNAESPIVKRVSQRHGASHYTWDWEDLRFVCLDMYPGGANLEWLRQRLASAGRQHPLILFFHYSLEGPYSNSWEESEKDAFARAIAGYNVLALFHGHEHHAGHYDWRGHPVFRPGAPRHSSHHFLVVRVSARKMEVAAWDFANRRFVRSWSIPVKRP
jgi:cytolysin (calcineurin-like family phosphatase)